MYTLSVDTTHYTSLALSVGKKIISHKRNSNPASQSESLPRLLSELMSEADADHADIDYIVLNVGPGSFTGIRSGISMCEAIKIANNDVQYVKVTSFDIGAHRAIRQVHEYNYLMIICNWTNSNYCVAIYDNGNNLVLDPQIIDRNAIADNISKLNNKIICTGSGVYSCHKTLLQNPNVSLLPRFNYSDAKTVSDVGYYKICKDDFIKSFEVFDPSNN